jgi:hypothetical protein
MRRSVALILIVVMSACDTARTVPPAPAEVCAEPGLWAVLMRPTADAAERPQRPLSTGSAAAAGAKAGASGSVLGGVYLGLMTATEPLGILLAPFIIGAGIVIAPVAAIVGAGAGVGSARPEAEIAAAETSMTTAIEAARPAAAVRTQVLALAEEQTGRRMYDCGELGSADICQRAARAPVAVVLSMTVSPPYFEVEGRITPDLRLLVSADAEIVRTSDPATVYRRAWIYRGRQHDYFEFAADDAALFRTELDTATDALAAKIVDDLLIGGREEVHASSEQPEGTVWTVLPPSSTGAAQACP